MKNIYKLNPANQAFLRELPTDTKLVAFALAKTLSDAFAIPSAPVADVSSFYKDNILIGCKDSLAAINEIAVLDIDLILEKACKFWNIRYSTVFPDERLYIPIDKTSTLDIFGITTKLSSDDLSYIENNSKAIVMLINSFKSVIKDFNSYSGE